MSETWFIWGAFLIAIGWGALPLGFWVENSKRVKKLLKNFPPSIPGFFLDIAKGLFPVFLVTPEGMGFLSGVLPFPLEWIPSDLSWLVALGVLLGHCFSPWRGFDGGNGISVALGALSILAPVAALAALIAFGVSFLSNRHIPLSALLGLLAAVVTYLVVYPLEPYIFAGALMGFVLLWQQEGEIDLILQRQKKANSGI